MNFQALGPVERFRPAVRKPTPQASSPRSSGITSRTPHMCSQWALFATGLFFVPSIADGGTSHDNAPRARTQNRCFEPQQKSIFGWVHTVSKNKWAHAPCWDGLMWRAGASNAGNLQPGRDMRNKSFLWCFLWRCRHWTTPNLLPACPQVSKTTALFVFI